MRIPFSIIIVAALSQVGASDCGQVIRDPGFDLWCGEELCAWKVTRGEIRRVATWHEDDAGLELVGPDAAIHQLSPVDSTDRHCRNNPDGTRTCTEPSIVCIEFSLLSKIDSDAVVDLNVDVFGDGTLDHVQRLPIGDWQQLAYKIVIPGVFAGVRFELAKAGPGSAQLANIGAELGSNCDGLPPIVIASRPLGAPCLDGASCASGICATTPLAEPWTGVHGFLQPALACRGCDATGPCTSGQVCGVGSALSALQEVAVSCVPAASKVLGEQCLSDGECATGRCHVNVCSTCKSATDCDGDELCEPAWDTVPEVGLVVMRAPHVCSPKLGKRTTGQPCASHADCANGACTGDERHQCEDGRACTSPAQCPFQEGLKNGACTTVGIQGGTCQ